MKKPSRLGKRIIGEEAAAQARQMRKGKVHRLGKRIVDHDALTVEAEFDRPEQHSGLPGLDPAPAPEDYAALSVKELVAVLEDAKPHQVLRLLASELQRTPEPRKSALRSIMAWETSQAEPRDSVVRSCMEALNLHVEEIAPTIPQPEGEVQPEGAEA
jgi:hypothetical protein